MLAFLTVQSTKRNLELLKKNQGIEEVESRE